MPSGLEHSKKSFELRYNHDPLPHKKKILQISSSVQWELTEWQTPLSNLTKFPSNNNQYISTWLNEAGSQLPGDFWKKNLTWFSTLRVTVHNNYNKIKQVR